MRLVVFGGNGQLGSEWNGYLERNGHDFASFASSEADITHTDRIREILETETPEIVINCAAYTDVDGAETDREGALTVNAHAVSSLAKLCAQRDIRLVHYSTDYVFPGRQKHREDIPEGYRETDTASPVNWYGETKYKGEQEIRETAVSHLIIRTSWLCGKHGDNFIKTMLKLAEEKDAVKVVDDQWGSPSFTRNVVHNTHVLLQGGYEGTYHVTTEGLITWHDLAVEVFDYSGMDPVVEPVSSETFSHEARRPAFSKLNIDKLRAVPGSDIWNWKQGVRFLLDELQGR